MNPGARLALMFAGCAAAAAGLVAGEGWVERGYPDPVVGVKLPTACAGVTEGVVLGKVYTTEQCLQMTAQAMVKHAQPIMSCFPDDAPAGFVGQQIRVSHNIGVAGFKGSTMCSKALAGDYRGSCEAITLWYKAGGLDCRTDSRCRGLWLDRLRSRDACLAALR